MSFLIFMTVTAQFFFLNIIFTPDHFCTGLEYSRVVDKGHRESFLSNCSKTKLVVVTFNRNFLTVALHASTTHRFADLWDHYQ